MEDPTIEDMTIAGHAAACVRAFDQCLSRDVMPSHDNGWTEDQLAGFNIWVTNLGVFAHGHASVDHRLRDCEDIRNLMLQLLDALRENLLYTMKNGTYEHGSSGDESEASEDHSPTSSTSSFTFSSISSSKDADDETIPAIILEARTEVQDAISRLNRLSTSIRNSGLHYRDLKAATFVDRDEDDDWTAFYARLSTLVVNHKFPDANEVLRLRAAKSLAQRRNQLAYRRRHQQKLARKYTNDRPLFGGFQQEGKISLEAPKTSPEQKIQAPEPLNIKQHVMSNTSASILDPRRFVNRPRSTTSKAPSTVMLGTPSQVAALNFPPEPKLERVDFFECPYCFILCPAKESRGKHWQHHVMKDLAPYICVFEECTKPQECFQTFSEWISHIQLEHAPLHWDCFAPVHDPESFDSQDLYIDHMRSAHPGTFADSQLLALAQMSARADSLLFDKCPFCNSLPQDVPGINPDQLPDMYQNALQRHVAQHLQSLALMSLAWLYNSEDDDNSENDDSNTRDSVFGRRDSVLALKDHEEGALVFQDPPDLGIRNDSDLDPDWNFEGCLQSLYFDGMNQQESDIQKECEGTCGWLLAHEKYLAWKGESSGLLWIKGSPGTGKSTLMKYALEKEKLNTNYTIASFFFHGRGNNLQKQALGLWRSLLHQILAQIRPLLLKFTLNYEKNLNERGQPRTAWYWHERELQDFFEDHIVKHHPVRIFIDALNECDETVTRELVKYFRNLVSSDQSKLSICFSCRHYPTFEDYPNFTTTIRVEEENEQDILTYIQENLGPTFADDQENFDALQNEISSKASGCFQWVNLLVQAETELYSNGSSMKEIRAEFLEAPVKLMDLYRTALDLVSHRDRPKAVHLMQWLYLAARPLSLTELRYAMASDWSNVSKQPYQTHQELEDSNDYEVEQMEKLVRNLSGGLAEIVSQEDERIVQLIHESVRDFLVQDGLRILSGSNDNLLLQGHYRLARACLNYATLDDICDRIRANQIQQLPFLKYAVTYWGFHAEKAGLNAVSQNDLPAPFWLPSDVMLQRWIHAYRLIDNEPATLVHYSSEHGLQDAIRLLLGEDVDVDSEDKEGQTPLLLAARNGHTAVVELLLERVAKPDCKNKRGQTPLIYAARNGHEEVVELLLGTNNVDANSRNQSGQTALWYAARNGHDGVVKLLLERDIIIDSRDNDGQTPLSWAANNGHERLVKLLLERKADASSRDAFGRTPLWYAAENGYKEVVKLLLEADAKDNEGKTPLSWAVTEGMEKVVKELLEGNADLECRDDLGNTPLAYAADGMLALLLEKHLNLKDEP
ncbi:uncharacterized protein PAC_10214 [Phialocephala subalpina]|uniref:Uncharacterized protein n=1 Tax=Phialocephala subalpina TaxID=576137 RepID=A0A1L7X5M7_9HELO|nr:uncharacterized protein PAC_10214 [Phialocephala subalpina]